MIPAGVPALQSPAVTRTEQGCRPPGRVAAGGSVASFGRLPARVRTSLSSGGGGLEAARGGGGLQTCGYLAWTALFFFDAALRVSMRGARGEATTLRAFPMALPPRATSRGRSCRATNPA